MALNVGELYAKLSVDSKGFDKGLGQAESRFGGMAKTIGGMAVGMVAGLTTALAGATTAVMGFGVKFNAQMEQSAVAWETLLGGADEAQKMLKDISDFTKSTPFDTENVDMMAKYMHNAGLEGEALFNQLMKNADVASAFAIPASEAKEFTRQMSQVQQAGVAYTEDLNILADRGIPIFKAIADEQGIMVADVKKMASEGKITSDIYMTAFNNIAKGVEGASAKQSKTLNGMISTLKDNLAILSGEISKPFFNMIKDVMPRVIGFVEGITQAFQDGGIDGVIHQIFPKETAFFIQDLFSGIKKVVSEVIPIVVELAQTWMSNIKMMVSVVSPLIQLVGQKIMEVFSGVIEWWNSNGSGLLENVRIVFQGIWSVVQFIMPAILAVVSMIFENIKGVISGALNIISGVFKIFAGLFTGDWSKMWDGVKQLVKGAIQFLWNLWNLLLVGKLVAGVKALGTKMVGGFKSMWTNIKNAVGNFLAYIQGLFTKSVANYVNMWKGFFNNIKTIFNTLRAFGASIWSAITQAIRTAISNLVNTAKNNIQSMATGIKFRFQGILSTAKSIFNSIKNAITNPIKTAKSTILGIITTIKNAFSRMKITIPKPKLPKINVGSKKIAGVPIPTFSVDWFKTGGIATGPAIAGIGEAGSEAIIPLSGPRMRPFASAIAKQMGDLVGGFQERSGQKVFVIRIGDREIVKAVSDPMDRDFQRKRVYKRRSNGKGN